ncbi:hypothetical protein JOS77_28690 [Chromobacterium haemolyticum]|nr:hypothetical protein JOS77_28690 [Chromobacterium haemolyticum]
MMAILYVLGVAPLIALPLLPGLLELLRKTDASALGINRLHTGTADVFARNYRQRLETLDLGERRQDWNARLDAIGPEKPPGRGRGGLGRRRVAHSGSLQFPERNPLRRQRRHRSWRDPAQRLGRRRSEPGTEQFDSALGRRPERPHRAGQPVVRAHRGGGHAGYFGGLSASNASRRQPSAWEKPRAISPRPHRCERWISKVWKRPTPLTRKCAAR